MHPFVIGMKGHCSAKIDGCPSRFACGFTEETLKALLADPSQETITLCMEVKNACSHVKGKPYGQLRGPARDGVIEDLTIANQQPSEYAKHALDCASASEYHSNQRGAVLTKVAAQNIS